MNTNSRRMKRQIRDHNQTICVSNATNSRSPNDLKSRIFIGNLNTSVITKRHLHLIFIQFGEIKAISMHKGYAFIQYDDQMDAINAVLTQDGQMLAGQAIDVNLVTEPKPHQKSSKTSTVSNGSETSGDMTTETENNSMENCVESDTNYTNFENTINEMIVECDSVHSDKLHSEHNDMCGSEYNAQQTTVPVCEVQTKKVKLDINSSLALETNLDNNNDNCSENFKSFDNSGSDQSKGRSTTTTENKTIYADPNINKYLINSSDNNYCYLNEQNSPLSSLLSNPSLGLLLSNNNNNNSQRLSQETQPLALTQLELQSYDILICGNCRTFFTSLPLFIQHKRNSKCRLRFVCRCQPK